ncbi:MAG: DUF6036 family nucleotidyltransferase [Nanoarchaeota archaeon]
MISIDKQQKLLLDLSKELQKPITAYAVGGTAMMFLGLKESTLDVDLVFEDTESKDLLMNAAQAMGYQKMDAVKIYGNKKNKPDMLTRGDERLDLFVRDVIDFTFSKNMQQRAADTHQFGDKLTLKIANIHDLILMKCATSRLKDKDDVRSIILSRNIDWNIIIKEAQNQVILGRPEAIFNLGEFLEALQQDLKEKIPDTVINQLWELVKKQAEEKTQIHKK